MTTELHEVTREQLEERRRAALARLDISERDLRQRAVVHVLTPEERDVQTQLEEIDSVRVAADHGKIALTKDRLPARHLPVQLQQPIGRN